ncbi:zingipain-2-like [Neltuma alba]|uniref:zingipain-2-like n=1 Tax=Neltuma alba TaxID=207710 RepID=UPI0010A44765|nr:zingipain-2-like [Prosopis alba]
MSSLAITKFFLLFLVSYPSISLTSSSSVPDEYTFSDLDLDKFVSEKQVFHLFQIWKKETGREYQTLGEEAVRFQIFKSNLKEIREKNAERKSPSDYSLGLNEFSDMTYEEFSKIYLHQTEEPIMEINNRKMILNDASCPDAPSSWDWRTKGAVTRVKNQGSCGSCWAFSTTGAIEGIYKLATGNLVSVSEQQLLSCEPYNLGCEQGGWYTRGFEYVIKNGGIASEEDYPYIAQNGICDHQKEKLIAATIDGYVNKKYKSERALFCAAAQQPVSFSMYVSNDFKQYKQGIFDGSSCIDIAPCTTNHAMLLVGYGSDSDSNEDYWIVKNSWGTSWGQDGYIFVKRNTNVTEGVCNSNCYGAYPTKSLELPLAFHYSFEKTCVLHYCHGSGLSYYCCKEIAYFWRINSFLLLLDLKHAVLIG